MSCHGCAVSFGFLKKEYGCPMCKFAYCKKCLRFNITSSDGKKLSVCKECSSKDPGGQSNVAGESKTKSEKIGIMKAFHQLQSLENPVHPPITLYRDDSNSRLERLKRGLSIEDQKIVERLELLRQTSCDLPSGRKSEKPEEEVALRLARLKGVEPATLTSPTVFTMKAPESEADLITRITEEVKLDTKHHESMVSSIEERLAKLREGSSYSKGSTSGHQTIDDRSQMELDHSETNEDLSEEEQVKRLMERFAKEASLDTQGDKLSPVEEDKTPDEPMYVSESEDDVDVDDLCSICDEKRATFSCKECDGDKFCNACFSEYHKEIGEIHKPRNI